MAIATSLRAGLAESLESLVRSSSVDSAWSTSSGRELAGHRHGRRRPDSPIGIGQERSRERRGIFVADRRQRPNCGGTNARVAVAEHATDVRDPLLCDVAAHVAKRRQRAPADLRRLVVEEQRRHEIALVERLEDVDGVDDPRRIGVRQLLHQCFDRRELRSTQSHFLRLDHAGGDAAAERGQVFALGPD